VPLRSEKTEKGGRAEARAEVGVGHRAESKEPTVARPLETRNKGSENASPRFSERDTPFLGRTTGHATGTCVRPSLPTTAVGLNPGEFTWLAGRSGVCEWRFVDLCSRADMKTPCKARITTEYRVEYESPIEVAAGERVRVGREDSEFPGWKWCEALDGHAGWVPVEFLSEEGAEATVRQDYSARELAVQPGEEVMVEDARHEWLLVRNARGERGWIPASHAQAL
jgi:SH3-like domain-containing protein